jgi:hypothetical protein
MSFGFYIAGVVVINMRKTRSTVHGVRVHPDVIDLEVRIDSPIHALQRHFLLNAHVDFLFF